MFQSLDNPLKSVKQKESYTWHAFILLFQKL
uniref:Uncharacterized protein n=2 Tax=Tetraselmis sp. GSL018 TaxID=582737 RepID=A0A061RJS0_9CHLO